jgi:tetratricopeptide (TPR) repeat protein
VSQVQPLLVVFEDLHWIDSATQALLDGLVESLPTARLLLLVNYRPEYQHAWGGKTYYLQLRIDPLAPESAEALLRALLGEDTTLAPLTRMLIERTEGNPFFLEESVQTLVETRVLMGERGGYRLVRTPEAIQIPATAQAILAARIDRLPPGEKRLLQAAAVIGKDVPFPLLQAIADAPEDSLRQGLRHLQEAEFLYETSLFPDLEYTFKHALTHEVAYASLLKERRRSLHARIARAIEALAADRLAEHVERLAHHALRGELWEEAPGYLHQAGRRALGRSAYREAAGWLEQALEALGHVHESRATRELAIDLRLDLRNALWPAGDHAPILARLREAEALAEALGDQRRLVEVRQMLANSLQVGGESRLAIEVGERVRAIAARLGDDPLSWSVSAYMAAAHASLGEFRRAVELLGPVVDAVQDHPQGAQAIVGATFEPVYARFWLAVALGALGEFREACLRGQEAVTLAADQPARLVMAQLALGVARLNQGDLVPAIASLERAVAVCREWDIVDWLGGAATALGLALVLEGRVSEGRAIAHEGLSRIARARGPSSGLLVTTGEAELEAGDPDAALALAEQALGLARKRGEQGSVARTLRLLGAIASERETAAGRPTGSRHDAAILFGQALALAGELGMRPLAAHCHLGLGKLYRRTGDGAKAAEHLTTASAMYREMDMGFWLEKVAAAVGGDP